MKYIVNEMFASIKGEGVHLGEPMNFVRMARCNLTCDHCDTQFNSPAISMTVQEIIGQLLPALKPVVLTGGEPTAQKLEPLIRSLYERGYLVHIESNGTLPFPDVPITWVCISPKLQFGEPLEDNMLLAHEIKMPILTKEDIERAETFRGKYRKSIAEWFLLPWNDNFEQVRQGTELGPGARDYRGYSRQANELCIDYAKRTGTWRVALQGHKYWGIQ